MFGLSIKNQKTIDVEAKLEAVGRSQAVIEFEIDGTIIDANENFLAAMGYAREEIRGQHHRMFMPTEQRDSAEYHAFWQKLGRGEFQASTFRRITKDGRDIWIQAAYTPIIDKAGRPVRVIKVATDVTEQVQRNADYAGQIAAIGKAQAVIEFNLDGTIITANENFLDAMGYGLEEIQGQHHRMFVSPEERNSSAYEDFWSRLRNGEYQTGEYKRFGKGGREIWIQASYNPIFDLEGRPRKVVKFATDVTQAKLQSAEFAGQIDAIDKSQAVIHFNLDGTIITANQNFLDAMGYTLEEIQGQHHAMFMPPEQRGTPEYSEFWASLGRGTFQANQYKRIAKGGREIWIQASYNPIMDLDGKPSKVVKFASDITDQVLARRRAEHVGQLLESVAAGSEQLSTSVREISGSMSRSKDTTSQAFDLVVGADRATEELAKSTKSMGGIVEAINNITGQINLLALNATIESARAGDAGKGFAVVANEVKNLANQAKNATQQIADTIDGMQGASGEVVSSLSAIRGSMEQVLEYVASTASAVEEQSVVANDMTTSMQRAAEEANRMH